MDPVPTAYSSNHSDRPERFVDLLSDHPQVRLCFSAHNHLGQSAPGATSLVGDCLFVHTGVLGRVTRDGDRHSRFVEIEDGVIRVYTVDHTADGIVEDARYDMRVGITDIPASKAGAITRDSAIDKPPSAPAFREIAMASRLGQSVFVQSGDALVEYNARLGDPVGIVVERMRGRRFTIGEERAFICGRLLRREIRPRANGYYFRIPERDSDPMIAAMKRQLRRVLSAIRGVFSQHALAAHFGESTWSVGTECSAKPRASASLPWIANVSAPAVMSAPAQKGRPAPVRMTARTASSLSQCR